MIKKNSPYLIITFFVLIVIFADYSHFNVFFKKWLICEIEGKDTENCSCIIIPKSGSAMLRHSKKNSDNKVFFKLPLHTKIRGIVLLSQRPPGIDVKVNSIKACILLRKVSLPISSSELLKSPLSIKHLIPLKKSCEGIILPKYSRFYKLYETKEKDLPYLIQHQTISIQAYFLIIFLLLLLPFLLFVTHQILKKLLEPLNAYCLKLKKSCMKIKKIDKRYAVIPISILLIIVLVKIYTSESIISEWSYQHGYVNTAPVGDIIKARPIKQILVCPVDDFCGVAFALATWGRRNTADLNLRIKDLSNGEIIYDQQLTRILDNTFHQIGFKPIKNSKGKEYELTLYSKTGVPNNAYTACLYFDKNKIPDKYPICWDGDRKLQKKSLIYRIYRAKTSKAIVTAKWGLSILFIGIFILIVLCLYECRIFQIGNYLTEKHLINFSPVILLITYCVLYSLIVFTSFKIHYSSIEIWNTHIPFAGEKHDSLICGKMKTIRSDEWLVTTPNNFGGHLASYERPASLYVTIQRLINPAAFPYFFLNLEYFFSYVSNFKIFIGGLSLFFVLLIITENHIPASLWGSLFVLFSSYNRWWGITAEMTNFFVTILFCIYFLFSTRTATVIISFIFLCIFGKEYVMTIYPPWQVTTGYLGLALVIGYAIRNKNWQLFLKNHFKLKASLIVFVVCVGIAFGIHWYMVNQEYLKTAMNTVYPGLRFSTGGTLDITKLFSGVYDFYLDEDRCFAGNICEASNFILYFPWVILVLCFYLRKKINVILLFLSLFCIILSVYMVVGFPDWLAKCSLFSFVPAVRAIMALGWGSTILTALFIADKKQVKPSIYSKNATIISICLVISLTYIYFSHSSGIVYFYTGKELNYIYIMIVLSSLFLVCSVNHKLNKCLFIGVSLYLVIVPSIGKNPIMTGLAPIYEKAIIKKVREVYKQDPNAIWLVFSGCYETQFLKASGINTVIGGNQFPPDFRIMNILDPEKKYYNIYNRYANINVSTTTKEVEVSFQLNATDNYSVSIYPGSDLLKEIGVKYVVFNSSHPKSLLEKYKDYGLFPLTKSPINGFLIYEFKNGNESK